MVEKIHSIATSGLNGESMMMRQEERLEMVKRKEERREGRARRRKKDASHVVRKSPVGCRKECCWSNQFLPCL